MPYVVTRYDSFTRKPELIPEETIGTFRTESEAVQAVRADVKRLKEVNRVAVLKCTWGIKKNRERSQFISGHWYWR